MLRTTCCFASLLALAACAASDTGRHGTISTLSLASTASPALCAHKVPREVCTRCDPSLIPRFKAASDWCGEHDIPESQCLLCHPDLTFDPPPQPPAGADLRHLSMKGEDVPSLAPHAAPGKVTLFDFYADWCAPCRKIDAHVYDLLRQRKDLAYRKLNMVSWETPLAKRHLAGAPRLPYVLVYKRDGTPLRAVVGLDLAALDQAIAEAAAQ